MRLYYEEMGAGSPLVLIHGFPFDHTIFKKTAELLQDDARVILPDLRGFGLSEAQGRNNSLPEMADDIRALMDELEIEKAILGGHSMGGYLGLNFCQRFPERVSGLALIASHPGADTEEQRLARYKNIERITSGGATEYLLQIMLPKLTRYPDLKKTLGEMMLLTPDESLTGALDSMAKRPDLSEWLAKSGIPCALLCGEDDMIMPVEKAVEWAEMIGANPLVRVPEAGHMLMAENPQAAAEGLRAFMKRINNS